MKIDWNKYDTLAAALAVSNRAVRINDGYVHSIAPVHGSRTLKSIINDYLKDYDMGDDVGPWADGKIQIFDRSCLHDDDGDELPEWRIVPLSTNHFEFRRGLRGGKHWRW